MRLEGGLTGAPMRSGDRDHRGGHGVLQRDPARVGGVRVVPQL
jgi:hypothetical protein